MGCVGGKLVVCVVSARQFRIFGSLYLRRLIVEEDI